MMDILTSPQPDFGDERCGYPGTQAAQSRPILLALCSRAMGSGKSTVADHLMLRHGFVLLRFAGPLKAMTRSLLLELGEPEEIIQRRLYGDLKEAVIPALRHSCRHVMQQLGTEFGRQCLHPNVWIDITMARAAALLSSGSSVVIDDMRFANELGAVLAEGGYAWRVERSSAQVTVTHASEGELDEAPMLSFSNNGTIEDLQNQVDVMLAGLLRMRDSLKTGFPPL